jgi:hypothetical protein
VLECRALQHLHVFYAVGHGFAVRVAYQSHLKHVTRICKRLKTGAYSYYRKVFVHVLSSLAITVIATSSSFCRFSQELASTGNETF